MKVGIDLYNLAPEYTGGINTFSIGLVEGIHECKKNNIDLVLLCSENNYPYVNNIVGARDIKVHKLYRSDVSRCINRLLVYFSWATRVYKLRFWYEQLVRRKFNCVIEELVDVLIVPTVTLNFYGVRLPIILCIHDIQQEYYPNNFGMHERILRWAPYRLSADLASVVQVSSRFVENCLREKFSFTEHKCFLLAPEGVDQKRFSMREPGRIPKPFANGVPKKFVFYPAQIWRHKNHELLMYALAEYRASMGVEIACVLTGYDYGYWVEIEHIAEKLGLKHVYYLGRVEFLELVWLYKNCTVVLALGLHESSSLPLREGAAFGKPLLCADIEPNIEAKQYLYLNFFQKESSKSLANMLIDIHQNYDDFCKTALENINLVDSLSWKFIAQIYMDCIYKILKNGQNLIR
jgi:hypothetical protein